MMIYRWENGEWVGMEANFSSKSVIVYTDDADSYSESQTESFCKSGEWQVFIEYERTYAGQRQLLPPHKNNYDLLWEWEDVIGALPSLPTAAVLGHTNNILSGSQLVYDPLDGTVTDESRKATYNWDAAEGWDADGNAIQQLLTAVNYYDWDYDNLAWYTTPITDKSLAIAYTFDNNNHVLDFTIAQADGYQNNQKVEYTYGNQNRAIGAIQYMATGIDQWERYKAYERTFDASSGYVDSYICRENWNGSAWNQEEEFAYDANGRETMQSSKRDGRGSKAEYAYDEHGNETYYAYYNWDDDNQTWVLNMEMKYDYMYDTANNNPLSVAVSFGYENQWMDYFTGTWYYSEHEVSGIAASGPANDLHVWIADGELKIENAPLNANVQIFDISGRVWINQPAIYRSINVGELPRGVYFVKAGDAVAKAFKQ
jgi:hypothetical protein